MKARGLTGHGGGIGHVLTLALMVGLALPGGPAAALEPSRISAGDGVVEKTPQGAPSGEAVADRYTLPSIIRYALKNNPKVRIAGKDVESEGYGLDSAWADRMPRIDLGGGVTRYRWDMPLSPVVITIPLGAGTEIPEFRRTIWDTGITFRLPLFRGGRLMRGVRVAEMKQAMASDILRSTRQDLVYNLSSVYYKIVQLEKLYLANDASVKQLELHKRNVEIHLKAGVAPRLDLLKTEVELSHAMEARLQVKNNAASAYELLKTLMGMDDMTTRISISEERKPEGPHPSLEESLPRALAQRPDFKAAAKRLKVSEERVGIARGKRFPDIYAQGQYGGQAGANEFAFKENWYVGVKFSVPVFDGGLIKSEIDRERAELEKAREEERSLKLTITREVRDAHLAMENALERIAVTGKAIESARENLRVEMLKYDTGAGISMDVIDARTALLRAESDSYQALFDRETAIAYLKRAIGDEGYDEEAGK
jgi:outer membrane protein